MYCKITSLYHLLKFYCFINLIGKYTNLNKILFSLREKDNKYLINFEYYLPHNQILNEFYFFENFLWEFLSKSTIPKLFIPFYISIVVLILYLFSIFIFKIVECTYFMRFQYWRIQTFLRITKLIVWNTCLLIIITKFESIFRNKQYFDLIMKDLKIKFKEADLMTKLESGFERSFLVDYFSNFRFFLASINDFYIKAFIYIAYKFCVLNVLKFYFFIEIIIFLLFKHKYSIPYLLIYAGMSFIVFPEYNFFISDISNYEKNNITYRSINQISYPFDFISFCYSMIFILIGYLVLYLYRLRISVWKKSYFYGDKVKITFYSIFIVGVFLLIELFLKLIKMRGIISKIIIVIIFLL